LKKLGNHIINRVKTRLQRNLKDPDQRSIILEKTLRQFSKKMEGESDNGSDSVQEAFALLDQLAYEFEGFHIDILEIYEKAYEKFPGNPRILRSIVGLLRSRDAHDKEAIRYYRELSEIDTENFQLMSLLVDCFKQTQQPFPLMMTYEKIIKKFREKEAAAGEQEPAPNWNKIQRLYENAIQNLGDIYANMGRTDEEAVAVYKEALQTEEINQTILNTLVRTYYEKERLDQEALGIYEIYLAYDPGHRLVRLLLANGYISSGREEEGITILRNINEEDPEDNDILSIIVHYYMEREILDQETLPYYRTYFDLHSDDQKILSLLAHYYQEQGALSSDALEIYKRYLLTLDKRSPEQAGFLRLLGRHHFNSKEWLDVIETYEKIRRLEPESKDTIIPLASAYCEFERTNQEALKLYQKAIQQGSRNEKIHSLLCKYLYESKKRGTSVVKIYKDSLALNPKNKFARLGLCSYYVHVSDYKNGLTEALKILRFFKDDEKGISFAAKCLAHTKSPAEIETISDLDDQARLLILEGAFRKNPSNLHIVGQLSEIYRKADRQDDQAEKVYLMQLAHDRKNIDILSLLSKCYLKRDDPGGAFHYDHEIFKLLHRKISPTAKSSRKEIYTEACKRMASYILSTNKHHARKYDILKEAYRAGERSPALVKELASYHLRKGETSDEAISIYENLIEIEPENHKVQRMVLSRQIEQGNPEPVLRYCETRLKEDAEDSETLDFLIQCLTQCPTTDERITYFLEKLRHKSKENPGVTLALAYLYSNQKLYNMTSMGIFLKALSNKPDEIQFLVALARTYEATDNLEKAAEIYERILYFIPDDVTILKQLAHTYIALETRSRHALDVIRHAAEIDPDDIKIRLFLLEELFTSGKTEEAMEMISRITERNHGAAQEIIEFLEKFVDTPQWNSGMYIKLGYLYIDNECYEEALGSFSHLSTSYTKFYGDLVEGYNRILEKEPNYLKARIERGVLFKIVGNYEEAISDLETALALAGKNQNVLFELAECYDSYISHTREAPTELLYKLGRLYFDLEEYDKCIEVYQQIMLKERSSREAILTIGKSFQKKNSLSLALQYYTQLEMTDEIKEILYNLGDELYAKGDIDKTIEAYNQILAVDITYRDVSMKLSELRGEIKNGTTARTRREQIMEQLGQKARQRFELIEEVGRGTMGAVYKAYDKDLDEVVALKVLSEKFSEDEDAQERFRLEVKSARRLSHPNVVRIHDLGEEAGRKYITMEFVDGGDLKQLLTAQKTLSLNKMIDYVSQIASGLATAHKMGIIHRDIKPANILITSDKVCKLSDFGIAIIQQESHNLASDIIVGTPLYMSPEQNEGKSLRATSDIYSLGVVMYEMLTGSPPFRMGNIAYHHIFTKPPEMKGVDSATSEVVMKCLEKKPPHRYQSMEEILDALDRLK